MEDRSPGRAEKGRLSGGGFNFSLTFPLLPFSTIPDPQTQLSSSPSTPCFRRACPNSANLTLWIFTYSFSQCLWRICCVPSPGLDSGNTGMNKPDKNPCSGEADIIVVGWSCRLECLPSPSVLLLLLEKNSGLPFHFYNGTVASVSELALVPGRSWKQSWKITLAMTSTLPLWDYLLKNLVICCPLIPKSHGEFDLESNV